MFKDSTNAVTIEGMIDSQPGTGVSVESGQGIHTLHVYRFYPELTNEFGGKGKFLKGDCYGMTFPSSRDAFDYAYGRGYLQKFVSHGNSRAWRTRNHLPSIQVKIGSNPWEPLSHYPVECYVETKTEARARIAALRMQQAEVFAREKVRFRVVTIDHH